MKILWMEPVMNNKINYTGKDDPDSADDTDLLDGELTPNVSLSLMSDTFRNARPDSSPAPGCR